MTDIPNRDWLAEIDDCYAHPDAADSLLRGLAIELNAALDAALREKEVLERAQFEFIAMLAHQQGGSFRLIPVLLRGDEEVTVWDDPMTGERVYSVREAALAAAEEVRDE